MVFSQLALLRYKKKAGSDDSVLIFTMSAGFICHLPECYGGTSGFLIKECPHCLLSQHDLREVNLYIATSVSSLIFVNQRRSHGFSLYSGINAKQKNVALSTAAQSLIEITFGRNNGNLEDR
ncbi:uncharacterized protein LOC130647025 [Hydractinia symbiolongicarpus]|uniref:uncharacterized protein LOC130647025 n=1 Tax=Hydractinia symbiolongicarpus TaxID=13093 RepID=UPI00254DC83D|nr:uncharacterized protein LOC130647025 [Hydractinia symbiolongicarpus]